MKIAIVGHFGGDEFYTDGQSVKIKSLYEALKCYLPSDVKIDIVDTYYLKRNNRKLFFDFIKAVVFSNKIIFLPASRGRKYFFKLFYFINILTKKQIYHDCIAGSLDMELTAHKYWVRYLNSFESNWMESPEQVEKLKEAGVQNCVYVPNFKHITPLSVDYLKNLTYSEPFRFCTFSRVEERKGIEDALVAIRNINRIYGTKKAELDVYGPIQPGHEKWFESIIEKYSEECKYLGVVAPNNSVDVLKDYFALLFPTQYYTEGMPGTIIDAMFAGVPVIARRWVWCDNMIINGQNGISYEFDKPDLLVSIMQKVVENPSLITTMKENCLKEAEKYSEKVIVKKILNLLKIENVVI